MYAAVIVHIVTVRIVLSIAVVSGAFVLRWALDSSHSVTCLCSHSFPAVVPDILASSVGPGLGLGVRVRVSG